MRRYATFSHAIEPVAPKSRHCNRINLLHSFMFPAALEVRQGMHRNHIITRLLLRFTATREMRSRDARALGGVLAPFLVFGLEDVQNEWQRSFRVTEDDRFRGSDGVPVFSNCRN